jgi:uncharacterized protein (DUF885 family)
MKTLFVYLLLLVFSGAAVAADYQEELLALATEVQQLTTNQPGWDDTQRFERYIEIARNQALLDDPELATQIGDPRGQGRWTDKSPSAIAQRKQFERDGLALVQSIARDKLSVSNQLNYDLLLDQLQTAVQGQEFPQELLQMSQLNGPQQDPAATLAMMPNASVEQLANQVSRLEALPQSIDQSIALMRAGIKAGVTPPRITLRDVPQQIRNQLVDDPAASPLLMGFVSIPRAVDSLQQAALREKAQLVYSEQIVPAYERLLAFTENEYLPAARESIAARDLPNGESWYNYDVRMRTTTDLTPEQIHEIGIREVARIHAEMEQVMAETGFKGSFADFLVFLRTDPQFYYTSAEDLVRGYRDIAKRADPALTRLFGVLPRTPYGVIPVPAYAEQSQTTAYYQDGSLKAGRPGYYFVNTYALNTRPRWEMEALTLHEAVPGHHLQISLAQEMDGVPWFRQESSYTAFVEGWGLYAESLGSELGFYQDPYSHFGQLTYEMWRAVRLVVDTGMHYLGWSRQQAIDYFKENAGKQEHDIIVEIDRYIVWPGQALAYKIGELKFKELRAYAEHELGEQFDIRAFHDTVLGAGAVPLNVLEANVHHWVAGQKK